MFKILIYFLQSFLIYIFFLFGRAFGLKIARKIFSFLFLILGPIFKSKKIIDRNLNIVSNEHGNFEDKNIINSMWKNYGMTFIEYIFLAHFKKIIIILI